MKDISKEDIKVTKTPIYNRYAERVNGKWTFTVPTKIVLKSEGVLYYSTSNDFGIARSKVQDPNKLDRYGKTGDYLARNPNGNYVILPKKEYEILFPPQPQSTEVFKPNNSKKL